jgi:hypothetical protein
MLFREIVTVYCDNNTEHANTLRGQNSESQYDKAGGSKGLSVYWTQKAIDCKKWKYLLNLLSNRDSRARVIKENKARSLPCLTMRYITSTS